MSISRPQEQRAKSPAVKFITWKSGIDQGYAHYYDKDKKINMQVELNEFAVLDQDLFCISGYDNVNKVSLKSNEVRSNNDMLIVKGYKDGKAFVHLSGTFNELKEQVKASRELFRTKCAYILFNGEICHLSMSGSTYAAWIKNIETAKHHATGWVCIDGTERGKKGAVHWIAPTFAPVRKFSDEDINTLIQLDTEILQPYLDAYLATKPSADVKTDDSTNSTNWAEFLYGSTKLGELSLADLHDLAESLINDGMIDSPDYAHVTAALAEHASVARTWEDKADKSGRKISDYSELELQAVLARVPIGSPIRVLINVALDNISDDIPF
jgi:hypothetical protein